VAFAHIKCNVSKTSSVVIPAPAKINTAIHSVLDDHPTFGIIEKFMMMVASLEKHPSIYIFYKTPKLYDFHLK